MLKPDVTFFGEKIHPRVWRTLVTDAQRADLVIVVGTSLKVKPISQALALFRGDTPTVLVNKERVTTFDATGAKPFDYEFLGDCDALFSTVRDELKW